VGRTGKWWAIEHTDVEPDIVCIAKGIASGMPLGVTMTKAEIMDWVPGSHASTFGGNPVAIAAALATIDVLEREGMKNAEVVGNHIMERIAEWPRVMDLVGDVRGRGLMIGVEIVTDKQVRTPGAVERDRIVELAFERGVLFLGCGPNSIRVAPPLVVSKSRPTSRSMCCKSASRSWEKSSTRDRRVRLCLAPYRQLRAIKVGTRILGPNLSQKLGKNVAPAFLSGDIRKTHPSKGGLGGAVSSLDATFGLFCLRNKRGFPHSGHGIIPIVRSISRIYDRSASWDCSDGVIYPRRPRSQFNSA
jgi:aminotransferase class III